MGALRVVHLLRAQRGVPNDQCLGQIPELRICLKSSSKCNHVWYLAQYQWKCDEKYTDFFTRDLIFGSLHSSQVLRSFLLSQWCQQEFWHWLCWNGGVCLLIWKSAPCKWSKIILRSYVSYSYDIGLTAPHCPPLMSGVYSLCASLGVL